jgi:hypothetical protein
MHCDYRIILLTIVTIGVTFVPLNLSNLEIVYAQSGNSGSRWS